MNKPVKPNITIPASFADNGEKAPFDNDHMLNGFPKMAPDVLAGDNLNEFIDNTYKGLNYSMAASDALNLIEDGHTLIYKDGEFQSKLVQGLNGKITNCITEMPQRINLEVADGNITLKAGSVVPVPDGPGVFDYVTVESDVTVGPIGTATNSTFWSYDKDTKTLRQSGSLNNVRSGDTDSASGADGFWFNTSANKIYNYSAGATVANSLSLPFAIIHRTSGSWDKVEQIFNGIGYIGSTLWRGKDLKYLVPNGRNKDGSLKNIEVITSDTIVHNVDTANGTFRFMLLDNGHTFLPGESTFVNGIREFNAEENYYKQGETILNWCEVAHITASTTAPYRITSLKVKNAFSAADYNNVVTSRGDSEKLGCLTCTAHDVYALIAKSDIIDITQTPTGNQYIGMDIRDKNNTRMAYLGVTNQTNGDKFITLQNHGGISGFDFPKCTTVPTTTPTANARLIAACTYNYRAGAAFVHRYSDGWCVQGGVLPSGSNGWTTATLLRGYNNTNYHIFINGRSASGATNNATFQYECAAPASATTFSYYRIGYQQAWLAFGYET